MYTASTTVNPNRAEPRKRPGCLTTACSGRRYAPPLMLSVGRAWSLISKYHNRNPYSLARLSDPKGANMSLPPFLETVSQVLLGLNLIPAIALLIGAVFDPQGVRHCTNHSMGNILGMFDNL
jgi:hypothetical protein